MTIKLEMRKADNSSSYEQLFEGNNAVDQIETKIEQFKRLFDFYSISVDTKKVIIDKKTEEFSK